MTNSVLSPILSALTWSSAFTGQIRRLSWTSSAASPKNMALLMPWSALTGQKGARVPWHWLRPFRGQLRPPAASSSSTTSRWVNCCMQKKKTKKAQRGFCLEPVFSSFNLWVWVSWRWVTQPQPGLPTPDSFLNNVHCCFLTKEGIQTRIPQEVGSRPNFWKGWQYSPFSGRRKAYLENHSL